MVSSNNTFFNGSLDKYIYYKLTMSAPTRNPKKPTDDPLLAVLEPALKVGAFAGKIDPASP